MPNAGGEVAIRACLRASVASRRVREGDTVHVVVVGCGRVGSELASQPRAAGPHRRGHRQEPRAFQRWGDRLQRRQDRRASASTATAVEAGIERAGALAAVTNGDNSNILAARIARETFGIERVVARIYDPRRAAIYQRLGIPTVATVAWTTDRVLRRLLPERGAPARVARPERQGCLVERPDPAGGRAASWRRSSEPGLFGLVALTRLGQRPARPRRADRPGGRRLHFVADDRTRSTRSATALAEGRRALMRVAIAGAGNVGLFIANDLSPPATRCS